MRGFALIAGSIRGLVLGSILASIAAIALSQGTHLSNSTASQPDPRELLKQSAEAIKQYKSYQLESVIAVDMRGGPINDKLEMPSSISVKRPDKLRIESSSKAGTITIVGDGEHTWFYVSTVKKYVKRDAVESPEAVVINSGLLPKNLPDLSQSTKSVKLTGEDTIDIGGVKTACWVIETIFDKITLAEQNVTVRDAVQITWISKARRLTLQSTFSAQINLPDVAEPVKMTQSTHTTRVRLDINLPDSMFVFTPPAGVVETEDWTLPGVTKPDLIGKPAPLLTSSTASRATAAAAEVDLPALKGKVVLLDFWATWCAPCKRELPIVEKLQREFHDEGLVAVGVTVGEDQTTLDNFVKAAALTYSNLSIEDGAAIVADLSLTAFPTVVLIDREGKIASYEVGARGEAALREDLKKLGIGLGSKL
jgi:cytochrome c biogenesis protein CcmG, thiol:disulfide interchange protein DsbE